MIAITFATPLSESWDKDYLFIDSGPVFSKDWLKAYHPKSGVVFLDENWSFSFEQYGALNVCVFNKKNDGDVMILAKRIKSVEEYSFVKSVGAAGIEPASSPM